MTSYLPIIPLLLFGGLVVLFAFQRDLFIKVIMEAGISLGLAIIFTMALYIFVRLPDSYLLWIIGIVAVFFFVASLFQSRSNQVVNKTLFSQ